MDAAELRIAVVLRAGISIVAVHLRYERPARLAGSPGTHVPDRAEVAVVARRRIERVNTPRGRIARIVRAQRAVVTVLCVTRTARLQDRRDQDSRLVRIVGGQNDPGAVLT